MTCNSQLSCRYHSITSILQLQRHKILRVSYVLASLHSVLSRARSPGTLQKFTFPPTYIAGSQLQPNVLVGEPLTSGKNILFQHQLVCVRNTDAVEACFHLRQ